MKKNMFKILVICVLGLVCVTGYTINNKKVIKIPAVTDQAYWPSDLEDLEANSDIIISATVLPESKNIIDSPKERKFVMGYTLTDLKVTNVFSGDIKVGDILTITENYFVTETLSEIQIHHIENYNPSTPNQEYIFFLKKSDKEKYAGTYFPLGVELGRYPIISNLVSEVKNPSAINSRVQTVSVDDFTNAELNLGELNSTEYREFFSEIVNKYYVQ